MSTKDAALYSLPTRQQVLAWQETHERLEREFEEMKARHAVEEKAVRVQVAKIAKLVEYGLALLEMDALPEENKKALPEHSVKDEPVEVQGASKRNDKPQVHRPRKGGRSWTATIKRIVAKNENGITYPALKEEIAQTHLAETLKRTEKAFYGGISKLIGKDELVKHKGHLFTAPAYHKFMEAVNAGEIEDVAEPSSATGGPSPNEIAVDRFLDGKSDGATTAEIVHSLLRNPPDDLQVTKNRNSIYNLLKRQQTNGKLIRKGDRYYLPDQKDETPESNESSVSKVHHDNGSRMSLSSGSGKVVTFSSARPSANSAQSGE